MRASSSWVSSMSPEYAARPASPRGTSTQPIRQRDAPSTSSAPEGMNSTVFSSR